MVLIIYTNEDNPATLKILVAYNIAKVAEELQIKFHHPHGK